MKDKNCIDCEKTIACFQDLSDDDLKELAENKVSLSFNKKETIAKQGSFATHLIFIKSGYLKLYMESELDDRDLIINIFGPNQLIGLSSLFESNVYKYSVAALVQTEVCLFDIADIKKMIAQNAEFALALLKRSHKSTIHAYNQMFNLTHKQLNGRIAGVFIYMARHVFKQNKFPMILNRSELANFSAMSTMSAVRAIKDLEKQGIIADKDGQIEILNCEALQRIYRFG